MMFLKQSFLLALAACLGLGLVGCQPSDPNKPNVADLDSIAVTPNPVSLEVGGVQALTVTGSFSNDTSFIVTFDSRFTSSAPGVAKVDAATGYVTAVANGNATITATHTPSGKTATTTVTVAPLRVLSIAVSPAATTLAPGETQALTVNATYNNATTRPVTAGSTFVSSNPTVATVDAAGVVTAVAVGTANIRATHTASGNTAEAAVTVAEIVRDFTTITFDEPGVTYTLTDFGGTVDSILVPDPTDGTNTVARVVKSAAAELWAGTTVSTGPNQSVGRIPFTATATRMSVRVYSPKPNIPVRLKVEDAADPTRSVETEARTTAAIDTWQTLTFDFANQVPGTAALDPAYTYNKVSIFFDFGRSGPDGGNGTYHFDDVTFVGEGGASGSTGTCVAPSCTDFSAAGISFAPFENQGGGTAALALDPNDATNDVVKFVKKPGDGDYFGTTITGLAGPATLTDTDKVVTLRVYSPAAGTNFLFKLEGGPGGAVVERDVVTTVAGAWETLSFNLSAGPAGTYATVVIFPNGRSAVTADTTMYVDELTFPTASGGSGSTGTCTDAACVDFSEAGIGFAPFENQGGGTVALALDPNDATNDVVQFVKRPGDGDYFGTVITGLGGSVVLTTAARTVTMRVYSPAVGTNFLLKFEGGTGGPATTEMDAVTTTAGQWETLSFVMPDAGTYTTVVIFPHGRSAVTADTTMYIDELRFPAIGGGSATPIVFASGYASNNRTVEGGEWGFYSGAFTSYANTYAGGGFVDGAGAVPAADSYIYLVVTTSAPTTAGYMGIFTAAPGYTVAAPNAGVTLSGQTSLKLELGVAAEWFAQPTNKQLTVRLIGSQVYLDGSGGRCQILIDRLVTPTTADLVTYTVELGSMTLAQGCNGGGFTSGVTTLAEALAKPIGEVHVQAVFPQVNTTVLNGAGTEYPTGFTRGSVSFE